MMYSDADKPPIPEPQGNTSMERLDWPFRRVISFSKEAPLQRDEERLKRKRAKKGKS